MASKMAPDLLNQLTNEFRGDSLNNIASAIGISPAKTQTALGGLVPVILSSLAGKASTTDGAHEVIDVIRRNNLASVSLADVSRPEGVTSLVSTGRSLVDLALGGRVNSVTNWIATNTSVSNSSITSLASLCAPVVLGFLGRRLGSTGLNASSLSSLLGSPSSYLQNAPAGLTSALSLGGASTATRRIADDIATAPAYATQPKRSPWGWLLPLLLGAAALGLLAYLFLRRQEPVTVATPQPAARTETAPAPAAPAPVVPTSSGANLGALIDTKLPNGVNLHIPSNGIENKLLAFIGDSTKAVDQTTWFSFDRLEFETDSATLKPSSREQLSNVAAILQAYPQVDLKIGGYTDNTGDPARNFKLSQDRATSTLNELVGLGVAKSRLAAEGYGQQFPVADNATPEGRQRNRRIDIRVTKK
ncbi:MAG TPA: OmpA family protein [Pyrinomonadaceae bacterium]|nr:OmpA family protein [Pyrinomonadaceae bacterium]